MIVKNVMRIGFLDLRIFGTILMQDPNAFCVGEEDQTSPIVTIKGSDARELTRDPGVLRVGKVEDANRLRRA